MTELADGDKHSRSLLANILDVDDDFILHAPQQPLPPPNPNSPFLTPHLSTISNNCAMDLSDATISPTHSYSPTVPNLALDRKCLKYPISPPYDFSCSNQNMNDCPVHPENTGNNRRGAIEKELKGILREIRIITDKIKNEVSFRYHKNWNDTGIHVP